MSCPVISCGGNVWPAWQEFAGGIKSAKEVPRTSAIGVYYCYSYGDRVRGDGRWGVEDGDGIGDEKILQFASVEAHDIVKHLFSLSAIVLE